MSGDEHIVVAHQPNFMPWLGCFYKMTYSHTFVLLDQVQYTKGGYTNRVTIKQNGKESWLTVPVSLPQSKTLIDEVGIRPKQFVRKHLATLKQTYGKCEYFDEVFSLIEPCYAEAGDLLAPFNISLIRTLASYLDLPCRFVLQSELGIHGKNNDMLAEIVAAVGGTRYVAGRGARSYMEGEEEAYYARGVKLGYQVFSPPSYPQLGEDFVAGCSVVDLLFQHGPGSRDYLAPQADPPFAGPGA